MRCKHVTLSWMFLSLRTLRSTAFLVVEHRFTSVGSSSSKFMSSSYQGGRGGGGGRSGGGGRGGRGGGRGEYYKNKYGGGGRGGGGRGRGGGNKHDAADNGERIATGGGSYADLQQTLQRLDGKPYPKYHDLDTPADRGWVNSDAGFTLFVERAQGDSFAAPTRCRLVINASHAKFPPELYSNKIRSVAVADYLQRALYTSCKSLGADAAMSGQGWSGPKGGDVQVLEPCQHILEQSAVRIDPSSGAVTAQVTINLPAQGRTILGKAAEQIFGHILPTLVQKSLYYSSLKPSKLKQHVDSMEDQVWLQNELESKNLVAFVRNGAILPRLSGVDDRPMSSSSAISFESPERLEVAFTLPNAGTTVTGMGIPKGITLICGGGFHGKSTLMTTLQVGVYPKIPGDGREFCVTSPQAFKIRAEDGRGVQAVDISPFINNLPFGKDTTCFSTPDASGSTSQAANIIESIEIGADTLLIDEDTCATNFMIRDDKMMQLVAPEKEPITPFVRVVRSIYDDRGISSVLVMGGSGDYFDVADNVLMMDCYKCLDATERAKQIVASSLESKLPHTASACVPFRKFRQRYPIGSTYSANGKVRVTSRSAISYGETELDLSGLEQIVSKAQTSAIVQALQRLPSIATDRNNTLRQVLEALDKAIDEGGLDILAPNQFHGGMARPRRFELAGAINRLRRDDSVFQKR